MLTVTPGTGYSANTDYTLTLVSGINGIVSDDPVLPNILAPVIVQASLAFGVAVVTEASLSFLGVGAKPPTPSWGSMIQEGSQAIFAAPWQVLSPGVAIAVTMLAFTFLGDGLRDALDPRLN